MARARNIKPGFYKNEDLAECSVWARYIFPGLWMLADREGRMEDRPKRIKGELLPFDNQDVEPLLAELAERGFLVRYRIDGASYIQISKFKDHQSPHYSEKDSVIKPPSLPESSGNVGESKGGSAGRTPFLTPPDSLNPDSLNPDSLNPDLTAGQEPSAPSPAPVELIPLQDGTEFPVTADFVAELDRAYPAVDIPQTLREIRAWNLSNPGKRKTLRGVRKHIHTWVAGEQQKAGAH